MKLKSITFRCSPVQFARLETLLRCSEVDTRTMALSCALEEFLDFAEQKETRALDLFDLVDQVDDLCADTPFADQA